MSATTDSVREKTSGTQTATAALVDFIVDTAFEDLPAEAVESSKLSCLDTLGICIAGAPEPAPRILSEYVWDTGGPGRATVVGRRFRATSPQAAWINGTAADVHGFSDISVLSMNHPSVSIWPAIWAVGEEIGADGKALLRAHVLAVEVADHISSAVKPGFQIQGWHPLAVLNTFGSAVAAGVLLGLDRTQLANALGIAGAEASGMRSGMGTMSKAYGAGRAARDGIVAAQLAKRGFTGPVDVFGVRDGFMQTFGNGADAFKLLDGLGDPFIQVDPGITFKAFPSCTRSHPGIVGTLSLMKEHGITAADVESAYCSVSVAVDDYLKFHRPTTPLQAKYSMEFCVAAALLDGKITLKTFTPERVSDPALVDLMSRVTSEISPELAAYGYMPPHAPHGCTVTIRLKDGRELVRQVDRGPWEPMTPPKWGDLVVKFRDCCDGHLSDSQQDHAVDLLEKLERVPEIASLMALVGDN